MTVTAGGSSGELVKDFLRRDGTKEIQGKLADYITSLREGGKVDCFSVAVLCN